MTPSVTRLGLLSLLGLLILALSVVALPGILAEDEPALAPDLDQTPITTRQPTPTAPALVVTARVSPEGIVLEGQVTTEGQRDALVDAARRRSGPELVVDRLEVTTGLTSSAGRDNGVVALQTFLAALPDGVTVAATSSDARLEISGQAVDQSALRRLDQALGTVVAASPGIETEIQVEVPPPPPPTPEDLTAAAQVELDGLNAALADRVLFATGSNEPTEEFVEVLELIPDILARHPSVAVEVVGHTDDRGSAEGNVKLSEERAAAAVAYLAELGLDPSRLSSRGAGEAEPIDTNTTRDGRARNRRVELIARS